MHTGGGTFSYTSLTPSTGNPVNADRRRLHLCPEKLYSAKMTRH